MVPILKDGRKVLLIVIDCMRLDQWMTIESLLAEFYNISRDLYFSIIPSATPFARNALFSGEFPDAVAKKYPEGWREGDEGSLNRNEDNLLTDLLVREKVEINGSVFNF